MGRLQAGYKGSGITELNCDGKAVGDDNAQALCASLAAHAPGLTALDLSRNGLSAVPPALCDIVSLQTLDLSGNAVAELPVELTQLTELRDADKVEWDDSKHGKGTKVVRKSDGRSGVSTRNHDSDGEIKIKFDDDGSESLSIQTNELCVAVAKRGRHSAGRAHRAAART